MRLPPATPRGIRAAVLLVGPALVGLVLVGPAARAAAPHVTSTVLPTAPVVHVAVPGDATVRLTWSAPTSSAALLGYRVARRGFDVPTSTWSGWRTTDLVATAHEHVWAGLRNGRRYQVRVAAHDVGGWGPYSRARAATPLARLIDRGIRGQVGAAYRHRLLAALRVRNRWTGSVAGCHAGTNSQAYRSATLHAVNYVRAMVGVPPVTFARRFNGKAQQAALMMQANSTLNHDPPATWKCYTAAGHQAAGSSNLALGAAGADAIRLYMSDPGDGNAAAGHRRWIMYSRQKVMGTGDTSSANDLWVFGTWAPRVPRGTPAFQAWPNSGYFPRELEPGGRWSLTSTGGASFAGAHVRVIGPGGKRMALTRYPDAPGYGDNTLVWQLTLPPSPSIQRPRTYTVHVTGITPSHGSGRSRTYRITLFSAT